jgi:TonB family protein
MPAAASPVAEVELVLDSSGNVRSWRILAGSGSAEFDASIRAALSQVSRIEGLTPSFLKRFSRVTVEFKLE